MKKRLAVFVSFLLLGVIPFSLASPDPHLMGLTTAFEVILVGLAVGSFGGILAAIATPAK